MAQRCAGSVEAILLNAYGRRNVISLGRLEPSRFEKWDGLHVNFAVRAVPLFAKF